MSTGLTTLDNRGECRRRGLSVKVRWSPQHSFYRDKFVHRPIIRIRAAVESLEARWVPSAIGFHDDFLPHGGNAQVAITPATIKQVAVSAVQPTADVKSRRLNDDRAPAALVKEAHARVRPSRALAIRFPSRATSASACSIRARTNATSFG